MKMRKIQMKESQNVLEHECKLRTDPGDEVLPQIIDSGIFIELRRKLCHLMMVHKDHPLTQQYFRSRALRRHEEVKHLANYLYMTHPFSLLCLYWEFFMFLVYSYMYIICSITVAFLSNDEILDDMNNARFVGDYIQTIDMIHLFLTGYYAIDSSRTIMRPSQVAKHYLTTYFFVDLISTVPSHLRFLRWVYDIHEVNNSILRGLRILTIFKIFRMGRWLNALELFRKYMNYSSHLFKAISAVLTYIILVLLMYAAIFCWKFFMTGRTPTNTVESYYYFTTIIMAISNVQVRSTRGMAYICFFLFLGYLIQLFLYAEVMQIWNKFAGASNKNENLLRQFKEYMKYKGLPLDIRQKMFTFFSFKFQNEYFNETQINSILSDTLKQEILTNVTKNHLEKAQIFNGVPEKVLVKIVSHLKSEIYLPDDVIVTADTPGTCMYFIYFGTVAVYTAMGKELCHLEDGDNFGEIALVFKQPRMATVVAVTPCELFRLNRSDFLTVIEPFAEIKDRIIENARDRLLDARVETF